MLGLALGTIKTAGGAASLPLEITNGPTHAFNAAETSPITPYTTTIYTVVATGGTESYTYSKSGVDSARFAIN